MANNNVNTYTIVDTESQKTKEIQSNATTVAELKRELQQNGFNVEGKTIQEALTRTEFKDNNSVLPHDVPYKGGITNDLVFRLTKTNKNVRSGMDRQEAYVIIKKLGLGNAVKNKFGKNFTQVSTDNLVKFIEANNKGAAPAVTDAPKVAPKTAPKKEDHAESCECENYIRNLVDLLIDNDIIEEDDKEFIFGAKAAEDITTESESSRYSKDELSSLLDGLD